MIVDLSSLEFFGTAGFSALHLINVRCAAAFHIVKGQVDGLTEAIDVADTLIYNYDGKPFKGVIGIASEPPPTPAK